MSNTIVPAIETPKRGVEWKTVGGITLLLIVAGILIGCGFAVGWMQRGANLPDATTVSDHEDATTVGDHQSALRSILIEQLTAQRRIADALERPATGQGKKVGK